MARISLLAAASDSNAISYLPCLVSRVPCPVSCVLCPMSHVHILVHIHMCCPWLSSQIFPSHLRLAPNGFPLSLSPSFLLFSLTFQSSTSPLRTTCAYLPAYHNNYVWILCHNRNLVNQNK